MGTTRIPYLDRVWNPTTGCTPISAGCAHCWARAMLRRFGASTGVVTYERRLNEILHWRKSETIGVGFMGDLFHADVSDQFLRDVAITIEVAVREAAHTLVLLTKRPERMRAWLRVEGRRMPYACWGGVSVEDQRTADERIPILLDSPVINRWVSLEPQLGAVDLSAWLCREDAGQPRPRIGWVVQGCESGPGRRPFDPAWARTVRDRCAETGTPYYLKQMPMAAGGSRVDTHPALDGIEHRALPWKGPTP